jgi:phosphomannomutase
MSIIKFGTDGWRAKMGGDFSFKNVRIFAQAYANFIKKKCKAKEIQILVNYDTRFLSEEFAMETAKIFSLNDIKTLMPERDAPLAPISLSILKNKCCGGINFTASFDKPIYNGIKVFTHKGVAALPEETRLIEKEVDKLIDSFHFKPQYPENELILKIDVKPDYVQYLEEIIDFQMIKNSGVKVIVDNLYGTSREYLDYILSEHDIDMMSIHNFPYSAFGGMVSSCDSDNLKDLAQLVKKQRADIGLATDIDGGRFGIIDSGGRYMDSNVLMPPLIEYLITVKGMEGGIVKSVSTTNNIRSVAEYYLRKVYTTPVGFKYLADVMLSRKVFVAVESSNGASLNGKVKIKDGILFSLLVTEMLVYYKLEMEKIIEDFYLRFPRLYNREIAVRKNKFIEKRYHSLLKQKSFDFNAMNLEIKEVDYTDGIKFRFEDSWLLIRESGTNSVIRIYAEATGLKQVKYLIKMGRSFIE